MLQRLFGLCALVGIIVSCSLCKPALANGLVDFVAGAASMYAVHEASHEVVGLSTGADLHWEIKGANAWFEEQHGLSCGGAFLYSAGLASQAASAEIILDSKVDKNSSFVRGAMAFNILNPIQYAVRFWLFHDCGDFYGVAHYSGEKSANIFAVAAFGVALGQGLRFLSTQSWTPDCVRCDHIRFSILPAREGGISIGFTVTI